MGLVPSSAAESAWAAPRSRCSQQYVSVSPSPSEPLAVTVNGVPFGMVRVLPVVTVGG